MRRFLGYILLLFVITAALVWAVDFANVWLIRSSSGNTAYKMERLYVNPEPDEIAIVGSSRACGNIKPSLISSRCFNYGVNGMGLDEVLSLLEVLRARQTDAPVILNLDPWCGFGGKRRIADYRLAPQSGYGTFGDRLPGLRFFGALRNNLVGALDAQRSVTRVIDRGAQLLKISRTAEEWEAIYSKMAKADFLASERELRRLIASLKAFAPRFVVVVISPCAPRWRTLFVGQAKLDALLARLEAIPNVIVFDHYADSDFTDRDFTDPKHLNLKGAEKFSRILCDFLRSKFQHD